MQALIMVVVSRWIQSIANPGGEIKGGAASITAKMIVVDQ
jgi:hypothetical protein